MTVTVDVTDGRLRQTKVIKIRQAEAIKSFKSWHVLNTTWWLVGSDSDPTASRLL